MANINIKPVAEEKFTETVFLLVDYLLELPRTVPTREKLATLLGQTHDELQRTLRLFESFARRYSVGEIGDGQLESHFGNLLPAQRHRLGEILALRKQELAQMILDERNRQQGDGVPLLESFDWNVSWILGSSGLTSLRQQICTLILSSRDADAKLSSLSVEMRLEQVEELIRALEEVRGA